MKFKVISLSLIGVFLLTAGLGCDTGITTQQQEKLDPITLEYWRVWDSEDTFRSIVSSYRALHPNVHINYRKLRYEEYERELVDAFAEGRGPDIFSINAGWVGRYANKIMPLPPETTMAYQHTEGKIKKETTTEFISRPSITPAQMKQQYIDTVADNAIVDGDIYGLPLAVDTMVLFYNRDLLNNAGITTVPRYWDEEFLGQVKRLTATNDTGELVQSAVPLGTSDNIERYSDIVALLMQQNGATMIDEEGRVSFHRAPSGADSAPGLEALRFYTDFANPMKDVYTWNDERPNSLEAFLSGQTAYFFGYAYHIPQIEARAPRLNWGVSNMLQIKGAPREMNSANFWLETVSAQTSHADAAWDFIQFAARAENVKGYLDAARKPTALRSLIDQQRADPVMGVFADQLLTARTWYKGNDYESAEVIIGDMIDQTLLDPEKLPQISTAAARKIQQTIK